MFQFITHRSFRVNLLVVIALTLLLVFGFLTLLSRITRHGEQLIVPGVTGTKTADAVKLLKSQGFDVTIQDSVYTDTIPQGTIIRQLPDSGSAVKVNRTVYLTVNSEVPPLIIMPDLKEKGLDFAVFMLKKNHLKLKDTIFKPDPIMPGSVLDQLYMGKRIAPGEKIQWGSRITLVVGTGTPMNSIVVPDLVGMTYGKAKTILDSLGVLGTAIPAPGIADTNAAFIYRQVPAHLDARGIQATMQAGQFLDLYLSATPGNKADSSL